MAQLMGGMKGRFILDGEIIRAEDVLEFLASIRLAQNLPGATLKKIVYTLTMKKFGAGELIWKCEVGEELYIIWKGEVDVRSTKVDIGKESSALVLKDGDYFGIGKLDTHNEVEATAVTEVACLFLSHQDLSLVLNVSTSSPTPPENVAVVEQILNLEILAVDLFRGITLPDAPSFPNVYGGQLVGQALAAASHSIDPPLLVHSLHCYFVLVGDITLPIVYRVKRLKDGNSFSLRHVVAIQKGQIIFNMNASFQKGWQGLEHQNSMPDAPDPEKIPNLIPYQKKFLTEEEHLKNMTRKERERFRMKHPIDTRYCSLIEADSKRIDPRKVWIKSKQKLSDNEALHRCAAAYASDWTILETGFYPHGNLSRFKGLSLDHSVWFHKPFKADEWLLLVAESPCASFGRGLVFGHFYTQRGELVLSVAQEGILRDLEQQSNQARL